MRGADGAAAAVEDGDGELVGVGVGAVAVELHDDGAMGKVFFSNGVKAVDAEGEEAVGGDGVEESLAVDAVDGAEEIIPSCINLMLGVGIEAREHGNEEGAAAGGEENDDRKKIGGRGAHVD